jgi:glycyl-tRNA synthetase beta chain
VIKYQGHEGHEAEAARFSRWAFVIFVVSERSDRLNLSFTDKRERFLQMDKRKREDGKTFLLELRVEEIPAGYIDPALKAMSSMLLKKMDQARIEHGHARTFGTPRRLAIEVANVAERQRSVTTEVTGPPKQVAFDATGKPTVAAEKFAEKVKVPVAKLRIIKTQKGEYLCAKKTDKGLSTKTIFKQILPDIILATSFPKTMRWADLGIAFARPVHSILALLGDQVVPFRLANIRSGRYTNGHRFLSPGKIKLPRAGEYVQKLSDACVMVNIQERRQSIGHGITEAADSVGGRILADEELLDVVTNLVEYPAPVVGRFEEKFLELPKEVLVTAMREHQKYFAVIDGNGDLLPCFVAVNNTRAKDMGLVAKGHERVIRARLEDARFFYGSDLEVSLEDRIEKLKGVLFQAKLGTMHDKTIRVQNLSGFICDIFGRDASFKHQAMRAAFLCKADLVSQVVGEFPKLQGIMGRIYAAAANEDAAVAAAVEEHYRPTYSGGPLPETPIGAVVAIADKIDTICGCFSAGLIPTGAADPYALRRQGIGIVQIMQKQAFSFSLKELIQTSVKQFDAGSGEHMADLIKQIHLFIKNRISYLLLEDGYSKDVITAVIDVSIDAIPDIWHRASALESMKSQPDFLQLAAGFKRVGNIIKKADRSDSETQSLDVDDRLFEHPSESALYAAYKDVEKKVSHAVAGGRFDEALQELASLRSAVDAFFDNVMVMSEDKKVRENRLNLLGQIAALFGKLADFSKIST